ncbi:MAG: nicotinate (nicotinamide) nucleotide adenylyltransferase [Treponema sp.]|jgi:nicotinate-nucleotide adenylyltransferase|nr:nicotinate (nicotinamide) nucleotide adenylyltransferase [Treponema sp.]
MKLAILGGSFNPVHMGHLILADTVLSALKYDRIILIPTYQSPFKQGAVGGSPQDRLDMLAASILGDPRLTMDDCEIKRKGVSYTIDTIRDIIARYRPKGKLGLVLGDDLAGTFLAWRRASEIMSQVDIIIARRMTAVPESFPYPHKQLNNAIVEISSAVLRDRIRDQGNWRYLVPTGARSIIEDRKLYGYVPLEAPETALVAPPIPPTPSLWGSMSEIETAVRMTVSFSRFLHSRNTALLCWDLCLRFSLDPQKGYIAGIAHDICKSLGDEEMLFWARMDGKEIDAVERKKPSLLHGRAAAVVLETRFNIHDEAILEAVRLHTTGGLGMGPLAKVVYIADKLEISREDLDPAIQELRETAELDRLFGAVLEETLGYLRSQALDISEGTLRLFETVHKRNSR